MKKLLLALLFAGSVAAVVPAAQAGGYATRGYSRDRYDDDYDRPSYRRNYRREYYQERSYCPPPVRYRRVVRYCPPPPPRPYYNCRPRFGFSFGF